MDSTLAQIKKKVRRLTASPSENQLKDTDIEEYIDTFYESDLPAHLKLWSLRDNYTFYTEPGEDRYQFDKANIFNLLPPLYIDGLEATYSQNQLDFYRLYPKQQIESTPAYGDGTTVVSGTITDVPMIKRSVMITAEDTNGVQQVAIDYPETSDNTKQWRNGLFQAVTLVTGTIDYDTGAFSVTFPAIIPSGNAVKARVNYGTQSRPQVMLYFNNEMILRPVPDSAYRVDVAVYRRPSTLFSTDGYDPATEPDIAQWWQLIAFGAAIKVFQDRQDMESIQNLMPFFEEQKNLALQRTIKQQSTQRTTTIYSAQANIVPNFLNFWGP